MNKNKKIKTKKTKKIRLVFLSFLILAIFLTLFYVAKKENFLTKMFNTKKEKLTSGNIPTDLKVGDVVYYNHKKARPGIEAFMKHTVEKGNHLGHQGSGFNGNQEFDGAKEVATYWKVWEIDNVKGKVTLVSCGTPIQSLKSVGTFGQVYFEHNAHAIARTMGNGYGVGDVKRRITIRMGSGLEGNLHTQTYESEYTIKPLTLEEVEEKLGITEEKKRQFNNQYGTTYTHNNMSIPLFNIGLSDDYWLDKTRLISRRDNWGPIKNKEYSAGKGSFTDSPIRNLIFDGTTYTLGSISIKSQANAVSYTRGKVSGNVLLGTADPLVNSFPNIALTQPQATSQFRYLVCLNKDVTFNKVTDQTNAWDLGIANKKKNVKINIQNPDNLNLDNIEVKVHNTVLNKNGNAYEGEVKYGTEQKRQGVNQAAVFTYETLNPKVKPNVSGIPLGYEYEIIGTDNLGQIDLDSNNEYTIKIQRSTKPYIGATVYYNHKQAEDPANNSKLGFSFSKGDAHLWGTGVDGTQTFNAANENDIYWKIWDIHPTTGKVTLISNKQSKQKLKTKGAVGYIYWNLLADKLANTTGYGFGADTEGMFNSGVIGSGIDNANDLTLARVRGAYALSTDYALLKLGMNPKVKQLNPAFGNEYQQIAHIPLYDKDPTGNGPASNWVDKPNAKSAFRNWGNVKNDEFKIKANDVESSVYKELIYTGSNYALTSAVHGGYKSIKSVQNECRFGVSGVNGNEINSLAREKVITKRNREWNVFESEDSIRFLVPLKQSVKFKKADDDPVGFDIVSAGTEKEVKFNITNNKNADLSNLKLEINGENFEKTANLLKGNVPYGKTQRRTGLNEHATYAYGSMDTKVKPNVTGIPEGYSYTIPEADSEGKIDIETQTECTLIIYPKNLDDVKVGDVVYYNHKKAFDPNKENLTKTTITKGNATNPGSGVDETQEFDAKEENNIYWKVWDVDKVNGEVVLVSSDVSSKIIRGKGYVGYIWWEHNLNKVAGILGHGYGANETKEFGYRVGSSIPSIGDTSELKTQGTGSRAMSNKDIEEKLNIDEAKKKALTNKYGNSYNYNNAYVALRDVGQADSEWEDKEIAKSTRRNLNGVVHKTYRGTIDKFDNTPQKDLIFNVSDYYSLASGDIGCDSTWFAFTTGKIYSSDSYKAIASENLAYSNGTENPSNEKIRYMVHLDPSIGFKKVENEQNAWDLKNTIEAKNVKVTIQNPGGANIDSLTINIDGNNLNKAGNIYTGNVNFEKGQKRTGTLQNAVYTDPDNKKTATITGIPEGYDWKVVGNAEGDKNLDLNKGTEFQIMIVPRGVEYKVTVEYEDGQNAAFSGKLKLKKGSDLVREVVFNNKETEVSLGEQPVIDDVTGLPINYILEFENAGTSSHELSVINNKKVKVKYKPEKKDITIEAEFYLDITGNVTEVPVTLAKDDDGTVTKEDLTIKKDESWKIVKNVDWTNLKGDRINYTLEKKPVTDFYVEIDGLKVKLRKVGNMPYSGVRKLGTMGVVSAGCIIFAVIQLNYKKKFWLRFNRFSK